MEEIVIRYHPHDYQMQVHQDEHRFRLVVAHRRFGKTTLAVNELIMKAIQRKGRYFYVAPYRNQAKMIAWDMFKTFIPRKLIRDMNETELIIRLVNGSEIGLKGADQNPDRLRGAGLHGVVLDEYGDMKMDVWPAVIRPMLADTKGWAMFIGTPKGRNHFHALYARGQEDGEEIKSFLYKSSQTTIIDEQEMMAAKKDMPEKLYLQEFECEWLDGEGSVFRKVKSCTHGNLEAPMQGHLYAMGVDLARLEDFTVMIVVSRMTHHVVHFERFNELDWSYQRARIEATARKYNNAYINLDATGVGDPIEEALRKEGLSVNGIRYTTEQKKKLIENLSIKIEQGLITFPEVKELIHELEAFTYVLNQSTRHVRYSAPQGMHDDCVNALALAVWEIGERLPVPNAMTQLPQDNPFYTPPVTTYRPTSSITGY